MFQVYKCGLAIYLVSLLIYGCITQQYKMSKDEWYTGIGGLLFFNNSRNDQRSHSIDYYSNFSEIICAIWALLNAYTSINESTTIASAATSFTAVSFINSMVLIPGYWLSVAPDKKDIDFLALHQHTFLAVITFLDMIVTPSLLRSGVGLFFLLIVNLQMVRFTLVVREFLCLCRKRLGGLCTR